MTERSAARRLSHAPDPSLADGARWYGHAECVSAAGREWGAEARALRYLVTIRAIGDQLNESGGKPLMRDVAHLAELRSRKHILRHIEAHWDGIGDWLG